MNPDQIDELGRFLQNRAGDLDRIVADVDATLRSTSWQGADAERFRDQWWPSHRTKITGAAEDVRGLGTSALNNATEQRRASGDETVARPGGSVTTAPGPSAMGAIDGRIEAVLGSAKDLEFIRSTYNLTQGELDEVIELMKNGGVVSSGKIPVVGALLGAADIGVNQQLHGWGDARTMYAEVNLAADLILTPIPGGGMAWSLGTKIGEGASVGIDWGVEAISGDTPAGHLVTNQLDKMSPGGDYNSLSLEEQSRISSEMAHRYDGWSGLGSFLGDAISF